MMALSKMSLVLIFYVECPQILNGALRHWAVFVQPLTSTGMAPGPNGSFWEEMSVYQLGRNFTGWVA